NYPLTVIIDQGECLTLRFSHAREHFDDSVIARLGQHFFNLLWALCSSPEQSVAALPMLGGDELRQCVSDWVPAQRSFAGQHCLHELVEQQARRTPQAIALTQDGKGLSYSQLNAWANQLAYRLIDSGIGPDVPVGLACERSIDMVVGVLAILKAGGAYVPLDPTYPEDRLAYMIDDSGIRLLLTQACWLEQLPLPSGVEALVLEPGDDGVDPGNPGLAMSPENLAYVIYTSGSTGQPKGTLLPHRNVLRLFQATDAWFGFTADDVWSLFHSYAFDFSVWEIFGALLTGGRLVIVPRDVSRAPEAFFELLRDEGVTVLNQTPSAFRQLMHVACAPEHAGERLALRYVIFGGEALDVRSLAAWFQRFGDEAPRLINMYGITETTVHVSYRLLSTADLQTEAGSPIGQPIPDLSWYVLDGALNPVPRGCVGELHVGGPGLARGYLGRAGLSAQRFVPDPFASGERLYRTGDLARYCLDGTIEYQGRIDHQVKVRGFRIELGEIEARLRACPAVKDAVVLAEEGAGGPQLVAYVVPESEDLLPEQLRAWLRGVLPEYMLPSHLSFLQQLPLTVNGKLDRRALPRPESPLQDYVAPRSSLEQRVAGVWQEVLKVQRVGLNDNFFELGGHSLLLVTMLSRLRTALGIDLRVQDVQGLQSLGEMAGYLEGRLARDSQVLELDSIFDVLDELEESDV
ncbi:MULTISPECIES: amino acid adenylation domain-containing protein, partial [unclassified Pseudomonas]|uniref:amino acid adenylation domain-containing protein n=1 Tax=unclassified Pseudomonas TaxID=196821 RepID=UPI002447C0EF